VATPTDKIKEDIVKRKRIETWARKGKGLTVTPFKDIIAKNEIVKTLKDNAFMLRRNVIPAMERGDYDTAASVLSNITSVLALTETDIFVLWKKEHPKS